MTQQYSLRWNNHQPNFISMFTTLLNTQTLVDVTLAAEGKQLQAHKVVLSACSTYFQALFVENPSRHPIVILKDVTFANLRTMVDFMYYGEVNVTEDQLPQVLDTAKLLKIKGLTEMPESTLLTRSQGASADFTSVDQNDQKPASPASPPIRRKRRRKSSTGSTSLNMVSEERHEEAQTLEVVRDGITVNSVTSRRLEFDERPDTQQNETHLSMGDVVAGPVEHSTPIPPGGQQWMMDTYPRYSNACLGGGSGGGGGGGGGNGNGNGGLQQDPAPIYNMNNALHQQMDHMNEYAQGLSVSGPAPGHNCTPNTQPAQCQSQQPAKRRRTTNPQAEENFQRAIEAVRFGGIGFCKAARMFGVNNRTLWLEYKKRGYPNNRPSIKSRIKREHTSPSLELKEEVLNHQEQQMALICPPHPVSVGFIDSRPIDFPLQGMAHNSSLNILGVNFNSMQ